MKSEKGIIQRSTDLRGYQILAIIGSSLTIWDVFFTADKMSIEVLAVSIFAIISMFLFRNHTKAIGVGLIILIASYILVPSGFNPSNLKFAPFEMIIFGAAAVTALRYKNKT
jgi:hypothetical protein